MLHNGLGFTAEATAPKLRTFFHIHSPSAFPTQYFAARGHLSRLCTVGFENFQVIQVAIQSWAEGLRKRHNLRLEKRYLKGPKVATASWNFSFACVDSSVRPIQQPRFPMARGYAD